MKTYLLFIAIFVSLVANSQLINHLKTASEIDYTEIYRKQNIFLKYSLTQKDTSYYVLLAEDTIKIESIYDSDTTKVKAYYSNGQKLGEIQYVKDQIEGLFILWYSNGQIESHQMFHKGKQVTPEFTYYQNGVLKEIDNQTTYDNSGYIYLYRANGVLKEKYILIDSTKTGFINIKYGPQEQIVFIDTSNLGYRGHEEYYLNGVLFRKGEKYNALWYQTGKWEEWYENGVEFGEFFFSLSEPNVRTGKWKWYNKAGELVREEEYVDNVLISAKQHKSFDKYFIEQLEFSWFHPKQIKITKKNE